MNRIQSALQALAAAIRLDRAERGVEVIEVENPTSKLQQALAAAGGRYLGSRWEEWCHSDTCSHQSHDEGTSWQRWEVPAAWADINLDDLAGTVEDMTAAARRLGDLNEDFTEHDPELLGGAEELFGPIGADGHIELLWEDGGYVYAAVHEEGARGFAGETVLRGALRLPPQPA
ncbi:hypothetical protein L0Y40_00205 [Candidatus Wolfebacteria bacterium]|nr:hypothetical protein [Candidatus Wolfebacteria bacterium]